VKDCTQNVYKYTTLEIWIVELYNSKWLGGLDNKGGTKWKIALEMCAIRLYEEMCTSRLY
jgi:hypothetical protein